MPILPHIWGAKWTTNLNTLFHLNLIIPKQDEFISLSIWVHIIAKKICALIFVL